MKNRRILKGASTYLDVDQKPKPMESDVELKNNQAPMNLLIDPDEDFDQIDTHFPIIAGKKKQILSDLVDDAGVDEVPAVEDAPVSEAPVEDVEITEEPDLEEVQANEEAAQNAAEMLSPDSEEEVLGCDTHADAPALASVKKVKASEEDVTLPDQGAPSEITVDDAVDVVDIDAMPDDDVEAVETLIVLFPFIQSVLPPVIVGAVGVPVSIFVVCGLLIVPVVPALLTALK